MQLLRDGRLGPVRTQSRARKIEQTRVVDPLRVRQHDVPDADVDLNPQPGFPQPRDEFHPLSAVGVLDADRTDT
jgi:hypothetical protein